MIMDTVMMGLDKNLIGQKLEKDVYSETGILVVAAGTYISEKVYQKMESYFINNVHIKKKETKDKKYQDYTVIKSTYLKNVDVMKTVLKEISLNGTVDDEMIMDMTNSITLHSQKMGYFIDCIHDLKSADEYTYNHSINVAIYAMLIGSWMKLPEIDIQYLVLAGILHDVGKSKIPNEILNKNTRLTDEEFAIMKKHSHLGYCIVKDMENIPEDVKKAVLMHHEKLDGSGYPLRCKSKQIPKFAQILAVADVYDALTSKRVYKDKITPFETFEKMSKMGYSHFAPDVLMTFLKNIVYYYVGFKLKLNTGEIGEILYVSPLNNYQPLIKVEDKVIDLSLDKRYSILEMV